MRIPDLHTDELPRAAGTCRVWWASAHWGAGLVDLLQPAEMARLAGFRRPEDRYRFVTGCVLLRLLLGELLDVDPGGVPLVRSCPSCGRSHGKPRLSGREGWDFSVTHSGDRVGVALARWRPVGVDVERVVPAAVEDIVDHLLTDEEARDLAEVPADLRATAIIRVWVRKEALVKAIGIGLRTELTGFAVGSPLRPPRVSGYVPSGLASHVSLVDLRPGRRHVASLAAIGPLAGVDEVQLDEVARAR
jgi:4'-phosphopantetheinyl transferase